MSPHPLLRPLSLKLVSSDVDPSILINCKESLLASLNLTKLRMTALFTEQENHENLQGMPSMAQLKEAIFGVDPVEVDVVRGDPQVDLEKGIEHDLLDSPSRDNSFSPSLIPNEEEAKLSLEISERQPLKDSLPWSLRIKLATDLRPTYLLFQSC